MSKIWPQELIRTGTWNDGDAVRSTHFYSRLRDAGHVRCQTWFCSQHAMHPNALDAEIDALLDNLFCHFRACKNEDRIWLFGDGFELRITGRPLIRGDARIY